MRPLDGAGELRAGARGCAGACVRVAIAHGFDKGPRGSWSTAVKKTAGGARAGGGLGSARAERQLRSGRLTCVPRLVCTVRTAPTSALSFLDNVCSGEVLNMFSGCYEALKMSFFPKYIR